MTSTIDIILASQSPYRKQQLAQLGVPFQQHPANIDESPISNETTDQYVSRLAVSKAQTVAEQYPSAWVIGSDQSATVDGVITGKAHNRDQAIAQLSQCSGKDVVFSTAVALVNRRLNICEVVVEHFTVTFRKLDRSLVERYIDLEQPFDCAGSFKVEGLGIHLFERLQGRDYNSLIGLPLIGLQELFRRHHIELMDFITQ